MCNRHSIPSSSFSPSLPGGGFASFPVAGEYGLVAQWVERIHNQVSGFRFESGQGQCAHAPFACSSFCWHPGKTGNAPKATGLTVERHYTGGLQCLIMHRRRETAPCLQYRKCGWLQRPTTGGKPPVYAALQLHETEAAPPGADPGPPF